MNTEDLFAHVRGQLQHLRFWVGDKTKSGPILKAHVISPTNSHARVEFDLLVGPLSAPEQWTVGDLGILGYSLQSVVLCLSVLSPTIRIAVFPNNDGFAEYHLEVVLGRNESGAEAVLALPLTIHNLAPHSVGVVLGRFTQTEVVPNIEVRLTMDGICVAFTPQPGVVIPEGGFVTAINTDTPRRGFNSGYTTIVFAGKRYIVSNLHTW